MIYYSTNNRNITVSLQEAVVKGLASDRGLFMPERIPVLPCDFFDNIGSMSLQEISFTVAKALFGDDVETDMLKNIVYDALNFEIPLKQVTDNKYSLELFHGPTLAFKDVALQMLPRLMSEALKREQNKKVLILTATSGDTGKAALEGFKNVENTGIVVFYPSDGVSDMQKLQMVTQEG